MKKTENIKVNYYFDEAGDPNILGRKGVNLIEKGLASKVFMVGYFESKNPKELSKNLESLRQEIINDDYYKEIPSIKKTAKMFHATDDCQEVREKVFRLLKKSDFTFYCIVARKKIYSEKSLICNLQNYMNIWCQNCWKTDIIFTVKLIYIFQQWEIL